MPYTLTQADLESVTDAELARGTDRLLPPVEAIPLAFWGEYQGVPANVYFRMADALYVGEPMPPGRVSFNPGFTTSPAMKRCLTAHLRAMEVDYQHRTAGLAYMISLIITVKE